MSGIAPALRGGSMWMLGWTLMPVLVLLAAACASTRPPVEPAPATRPADQLPMRKPDQISQPSPALGQLRPVPVRLDAVASGSKQPAR